LASGSLAYLAFHSLVCVDNNSWKWKSRKEQERPGSIHHVSNIKWDGAQT